MKTFRTIAIILIFTLANGVSAGTKTFANLVKTRSIAIAGLVFDSQTLSPIAGAIIYDANKDSLGSTNADGYFNVKINPVGNGEMDFQLIILKPGYRRYIQKEHWGDLKGNAKAIFYFGLKDKSAQTKEFSQLLTDKPNLSYESVKGEFENIRKKIGFEAKVEKAKEGNNNLFFAIDNDFYLVNNGGWIKIKSENDLISINGKRNVKVKDINNHVKRSGIKGMSPTDAGGASFIVYTKHLP